MAKIGWKCLDWLDLQEIDGNGLTGLKQLKIIKNGFEKVLEMAEMSANGLNSWKCNEMTGMAGYGKKLIEMA